MGVLLILGNSDFVIHVFCLLHYCQYSITLFHLFGLNVVLCMLHCYQFEISCFAESLYTAIYFSFLFQRFYHCSNSIE